MYTRFASALCKIVKFSGSRAARTRQLLTITSGAREIEERKIKVDDTEINYARVGTGDHSVLLLPGAMGTIWTDFRPQMENLNADKLTIVAWDPPGYGKSRPPDRTFPDDFFQRDAAYVRNLMRTLGYSKFSLIGWSDGGITSLLLASAYPDDVHKMVVFGAKALYIHPDEAKIYESLKDVNKWSENMRTPMIQVYGEDYFRKTWSNGIDAVLRLYEKQNGDLCKQVLSKIKCPTLIIHGARDALILPEHPTYLKQNIADSRFVSLSVQGAFREHYSALFSTVILPSFVKFKKRITQR